MIIYFTGTGNSAYVADALGDRLGDEVFCANTAIKGGKTLSFNSDKPFVFVFPVYLSTSPTVFRDFIARCSFAGHSDAYFVPTCAKADGSVPNASEELCRKTGFLKYRGCRKVEMPQNYITLFKPTPAEEKPACYEAALKVADEIARTVAAGEDLDEKPASDFEYKCTKLVEKWYNGSFTKTRYFRATDACIGCGACERGCPMSAIVMEDKKPKWVKRVCIHCMACISRCPKQAIEFGYLTRGKERHVCPNYKKESDK